MKQIGHAIRSTVEALDEGPWVNAELTLVVPLNVSVSATDEAKRTAMVELQVELLDSLPSSFEGCVSSAHFEDVQPLGEAA